MQGREEIEVEAGAGIVGDRYHGSRHRHVTVQSRTSLDEAAAAFGAEVASDLTRRNITIASGEVPRTPGVHVRIGDDVLLEVVRVAAPCKLLDDTLGRGAQEALRRRAGTVFRVLAGARCASATRSCSSSRPAADPAPERRRPVPVDDGAGPERCRIRGTRWWIRPRARRRG